jgi:MFS family permease
MTATLVPLLVGVSEGNRWGWTSGAVLGCFALAAVMLVLFSLWELRTDDPLIDLRLMRHRALWTVNLAGFAIGFAMFGSYILIPQLVQTDPSNGYGFGASVMVSGLYLLPSALVMLVAGPLSGRMSTRRGSRLPLALGTVFAGLAYAVLALLHDESWEIVLGSGLLGLGIGLAFAAMANLVVEAVPPEMTGVATGVNTIVRSIGGAIGGQVAAAILTASAGGDGIPTIDGYAGAFSMSAAGAVVAFGAALLVPKAGRATGAAPSGRLSSPQPTGGGT